MEIYVVTAVGVGIDTEAEIFREKRDAEAFVLKREKELGMTETTEMCRDCWKGFSDNAQCFVEIQIHRKNLT